MLLRAMGEMEIHSFEIPKLAEKQPKIAGMP